MFGVLGVYNFGCKSRPCENSPVEFRISALLKARPSVFLRVKEVDFSELSLVQTCKSSLNNFHMVSTSLLNINARGPEKVIPLKAKKLVHVIMYVSTNIGKYFLHRT